MPCEVQNWFKLLIILPKIKALLEGGQQIYAKNTTDQGLVFIQIQDGYRVVFQLYMRISFSFILLKDLRRILLIMRSYSFFTSLYVEVTYAMLVCTWYKNIFHTIAVLIVSLSANGKKKNLMKTISKRDSDETETRHCYC